MAPRVFIPSPSFEEEIKRSTEVKAILEDLVERGAEIAADLAPKGATLKLSEGVEGVVGVVGLNDRGFYGRLVSTDFKGGWWEFGTSRHEARPYLRPAVEALGLELEATEDDLGL